MDEEEIVSSAFTTFRREMLLHTVTNVIAHCHKLLQLIQS